MEGLPSLVFTRGGASLDLHSRPGDGHIPSALLQGPQREAGGEGRAAAQASSPQTPGPPPRPTFHCLPTSTSPPMAPASPGENAQKPCALIVAVAQGPVPPGGGS